MNFECKKCGNCCSAYLPLTEKEVKLMKSLKEKINKAPLRNDYIFHCPFLNNENKCNIYEDRPFICRQYTCFNYENHIFDKTAFKEASKEKFELRNVRKEIKEEK